MTSGLAVYDTMRYVACDVRTLALGQASSMAALLLAAGSTRLALPNARIMLHQPSGGVAGTAESMSIHAEEIIKVRHRINAMFAEHTKKPLGVIEEALRNDYFLTAREAVEFGLVDRVVTKRSDAAPGSGAGSAAGSAAEPSSS